MDASKQISHQDLNPTDIDRISFGHSFEDVRRALVRWEQKRYPEKPKYGRREIINERRQINRKNK